MIVDEAHERSLNIDFLLGCLHRILPRRPDLKVIITSATIDTERFSERFGGAPIVEVSGRTYPVEIRYRPPREDEELLDALADTVHELLGERDGDVLGVLPGAPHGTLDATIEDATDPALDALMASGGGPAWDAESFAVLREHVRGDLRLTALDALVALGQILEAGGAVRRRLDALPATAALGPAREDVARQLRRLVYPGMLAGTGLTRLGDVERYLRAAAQRLERLPSRVAADRQPMTTLRELEAEAAGRPELRWLIEEVRVAELAPGDHFRPGATLRRLREPLAAA